MGGISVGGGGHGGKKAVDSEIPLVPFIDLLLCCLMFLLVSAVWNQMGRIDANQQQPGLPSDEEPPPEEDDKEFTYLKVWEEGYSFLITGRDPVELKKTTQGDQDIFKLEQELQNRRKEMPDRTDLIVTPEDGVPYEEVIAAMDTAVGVGFADLSLSDISAYEAALTAEKEDEEE